MRLKRHTLPAVALLTALVLTAGCAARSQKVITGTGSLANTPRGQGAVLRVTNDPHPEQRTGHGAWGYIPTPNAEERFAEFLAHVATGEGSLQILPPHDAEQKLLAAGLEPTLQPTEQQIRRFADALGLAYYLTARVDCADFQYRLFHSYATVRYQLTCRPVGAEEPAWQVQVFRRALGQSDRETLSLALRETFQWLANPQPNGRLPACPD